MEAHRTSHRITGRLPALRSGATNRRRPRRAWPGGSPQAGAGARIARNLRPGSWPCFYGGDAGLVEEQAALSFGGLLRQLRTEARLTQEELAEAAGLSPRSVSDL